MEAHIIEEVGIGDSTGGRRPIFLDLNPNYGASIGVYVESVCAHLGLVDLKGRLLRRERVSFSRGSGSEDVISAMRKSIDKLAKGVNLLGIGIGISGFTDSQNEMLFYSPILGWRNVNLSRPLEREYGVPVFVENDINTFVLAELWYGAGNRFRNFICVTIGEGIGAGIVIDGRLYEGATGGAGEVGHMCIDFNGPRCRCGEKGCLEVFASNSFLLKRAQEAILKGQGTFKKVTIEALQDAANNGDEVARGIFTEMSKNLGIGLKNVVNLFNPEAIILSGECVKAYPFFGPILKKEIQKHSFPEEAKELQILPSEVGENGWLLGPATLALNPLFELPIYRGSPRG
jgi:predicted NBD/HSP70 family sugar kinase